MKYLFEKIKEHGGENKYKENDDTHEAWLKKFKKDYKRKPTVEEIFFAGKVYGYIQQAKFFRIGTALLPG